MTDRMVKTKARKTSEALVVDTERQFIRLLGDYTWGAKQKPFGYLPGNVRH